MVLHQTSFAVSLQPYERVKSVVHSVRFSPTISELVRAESCAQRLSVSEFIRRSALSSMRYMRRQALELWGR